MDNVKNRYRTIIEITLRSYAQDGWSHTKLHQVNELLEIVEPRLGKGRVGY